MEVLGNYDARHGDKAIIKDERVKYWMTQGAQASGTVHNLLVSRKIIDGKKVNVLPLKKAIVKEAEASTEAPAPKAEAPVEETPTASETPAEAPAEAVAEAEAVPEAAAETEASA